MTAGERLRAYRKATGMTAKAMGERAGQVLGRDRPLSEPTIRAHENGTNGISPDMAEAYGAVLKIDPALILFGEGHASVSGVSGNDNVRMVGVVGEIRAGAFAEIPDDPPAPWEFVPVSLPEYARASLYALTVVGRSMDRHYPDGSAVVICPTAEAGIRAGDHVVVRIWKGAMAETTLKEVVVGPHGVELWPRSTDAAYQTPIKFYALRDADEGPEIIGVVVGSFAARAARSGPLINV